MKLGLNTYNMLVAFDSIFGHHYLAMSNKSRSRFMPIMLTPYHKNILVDYGLTGSTEFLGIYSTMLEMWKNMDCKLSALVMKISIMTDGNQGLEVDAVLTQVGEDGLHVMHVDLPVSDAAILSIIAKVPIMVAEDTSDIATIGMDFKGLSDAQIVDVIVSEINQCEKTISEGSNPDSASPPKRR